MYKHILFLLCCLAIVGCSSKRSTLTGKKIKERELVSKERYRQELRNGELKKTELGKKKDSEILEATSRLSVTTDMIRDYIVKYRSTAQYNMREHGIPASITLAQGVLESGSGQGTLSRNANNHFGIKCHKEWDGPSVRHTDDAPDECFRKYDNPEESYRDHSLFLTSRSRYNSLFLLDKDDYKGWARGLKKAGYATDPKYADKLIGLIERYSLYEYDREVLGKDKLNKAIKEIDANDKLENPNAIIASKDDYHVVQKGDTLYSISKRYDISISAVQELNNLSGNAISVGQKLKLR
jgi:flagellum-specific peptidoglycan hydrolase FlgJ